MMASANETSPDWRDNMSLPECMLYMLKNEIMCDVTFHVGDDNKPIKAHKYMLSSRSPVFHTMFEGSLPEKGVISIPDIDESTFQEFLQYIYSDKLTISNDNVKEMLYISDKYITRVKSECEKVLQSSASTPDAAKSLQTAYEYKLEKLLNQSFLYIEKCTMICISSKHALNLSKECLELILKSENLTCTETALSSFVVKWTRNQCELAKIEASGKNMRAMAGHLLYLIRFPLVDPKIFSKDISPTGLLTSKEIVSIYQSYFGVRVENVEFSNRRRNLVPAEEILTVKRFEGTTHGWKSDCVEALRVQTKTDIWLRGIVIGSPADYYGHSTNIRIQVLGDDDKELYLLETNVNIVNLSLSDHSKTTEIQFPKPLRILQSRKYTITMEGIKCTSYYSAKCVNTVSTRGVTFIFEKSPLCKSQTDEKQGQFAGLMFSFDYGPIDWECRFCVHSQENCQQCFRHYY